MPFNQASPKVNILQNAMVSILNVPKRLCVKGLVPNATDWIMRTQTSQWINPPTDSELIDSWEVVEL
jgi:hypothetical protein